MAGLSVSFRVEGAVGVSLDHNNRVFFAPNVDAEKTSENIVYTKESVRDFYAKTFGGALQVYNERQKQPCRKIADYYNHIAGGKQEKPFREIVVQFGDMKTAKCGTQSGETAKSMLDEYMKNFQKRNPNLKVFNAVLHLDEATPHLHIDFVPVIENSNSRRGLPVRNSFMEAVKRQGFLKNPTNPLIEWTENEKSELEKLLQSRGLSKEVKNVTHKHKTVEAFKLMKDVESGAKMKMFERLKSNVSDFSPAELGKIKAEFETLKASAEQIETLKEKLGGEFVFRKIVNEEKLQYVADELKRGKIPFAEDGFGLHVPHWAAKHFDEIVKVYKPHENNLTWRQELKLLIDRLVYRVNNFDGLLNELTRNGYSVRAGDRKYISIKPAEGNCRAVRLKTLGEDYTEEKLRERIACRDDYREKVNLQKARAQGFGRDCLESMNLIIVTVYDFSKIPRKWNGNRPYSVENDYHINLIAEQLRLISREKISDEKELSRRLDASQNEIDTSSEQLAKIQKSQINAKDLISKSEFYFANVGVKLDGLSEIKFNAARDLLERYGIKNASAAAKLKGVFADNLKVKIPELKKQIAELSEKQDRLVTLKKTLERIKDKDFTASIQSESTTIANAPIEKFDVKRKQKPYI